MVSSPGEAKNLAKWLARYSCRATHNAFIFMFSAFTLTMLSGSAGVYKWGGTGTCRWLLTAGASPRRQRLTPRSETKKKAPVLSYEGSVDIAVTGARYLRCFR